jgi:hypothetical protein
MTTYDSIKCLIMGASAMGILVGCHSTDDRQTLNPVNTGAAVHHDEISRREADYANRSHLNRAFGDYHDEISRREADYANRSHADWNGQSNR